MKSTVVHLPECNFLKYACRRWLFPITGLDRRNMDSVTGNASASGAYRALRDSGTMPSTNEYSADEDDDDNDDDDDDDGGGGGGFPIDPASPAMFGRTPPTPQAASTISQSSLMNAPLQHSGWLS